MKKHSAPAVDAVKRLVREQRELAFLPELVNRALASGMTGVWLFGSRARGTHDPRADVDLLFEGPNDRAWSDLLDWIEEKAPTLLRIDAVHVANVAPAFIEHVRTEAIALHEL